MRRARRGKRPRTSTASPRRGGLIRRLDNRSGYLSADLRSFFERGLRAMGCKSPKVVIVVASPIYSRGCAQLGRRGREGETIVIAIAAPSRLDIRRLSRLFEHEVLHTLGKEHEGMSERDMWSEGVTPRWARGKKIRYVGRARDQL